MMTPKSGNSPKISPQPAAPVKRPSGSMKAMNNKDITKALTECIEKIKEEQKENKTTSHGPTVTK